VKRNWLELASQPCFAKVLEKAGTKGTKGTKRINTTLYPEHYTELTGTLHPPQCASPSHWCQQDEVNCSLPKNIFKKALDKRKKICHTARSVTPKRACDPTQCASPSHWYQ